jgi:hypothetical protein
MILIIIRSPRTVIVAVAVTVIMAVVEAITVAGWAVAGTGIWTVTSRILYR